MIPLKPFSVKLPPEIKSRIKDAAAELGYSENQFIVESMQSVIEMIDQVGEEILPKVVVLVRAAKSHRENPVIIQKKTKGKPTDPGKK